MVKAPGSLEDGACGATGEGGAAAGAPAGEDWKIRVNSPGPLEDCDAGWAAGDGAAGTELSAEADWKIRVNSPGSPEADFCEAGTGTGAGDEGAGEVPESVLNICVKLLGASEGWAAG